MTKHTVIRTIYLYLFSLVGIVLLIIGAVNFIDMGLKAWVFTEAEKQQEINYERPPSPLYIEKQIDIASKDGKKVELSVNDYNQVQNVIAEYKQWEEKKDKIDYIKVQRQRRASMNLSLIVVGLPLYLYHWLTIRREKKLLEK